jgi:AraC family L-rhamnose operon regulatory protein RhaS
MTKRKAHRPVYRTRNSTYGIDTCAPQREAIKAGKIGFHALTHGAYPGTLLPTTVLPGLCSLGLIDACGEQDWGFEPHRNEGVEIVFLETGHMTFITNERRHEIRAGDFTITRPWELHSIGDPNLGTGLLHWLILDVGIRHPKQGWQWPAWIMLAPSDIRELTHALRLNENPVWKSTADIRHAFREIALCVRQYKKPGTLSRLTIHVNHLLLSLLEALREQSRQDYPERITRERTVDLFLTSLTQSPEALSRPWTLNSMAEECGIKPTAFVEHCRRLTNLSPVDYLNRCRLERAAQRLRSEPDLPVTRIALECGFNTSQYFATRFRQKYGQSPRTFRQISS